MSGTIPPPPVPNPGITRNPNRVENVFKPDTTNNNGTNNVINNVGEDDLPKLLDSRGGSHVTNVSQLDVEDFTKNGSFVPKSTASTLENFLPKPQKQWNAADKKLGNQDKRLKGIVILCLPNDIMKVVIKCSTGREIWNDLILIHDGPSNTRDTKIATLRLNFNAFKALKGEKVKETYIRLKILLNKLENKDVKIPQAKVNAMFVKSLPKKWLTMSQTQRANNAMRNDSLATFYLDVEENIRSNNEFLADINDEFHDKALFTNHRGSIKD
nr:hypothetical protein [Tanacetum cinerariifolium]